MTLTLQERIEELARRTDGSVESIAELQRTTEELLHEAQHSGERTLELRVIMIKANHLYLLGKHDEARKLYDELVDTLLKENITTFLPRLYLAIGRLHSTEQHDRDALDYIRRSRTAAEANNDNETIAESNLLLGITLAKSQQYKEALEAYSEAARYSYQTNNTRRMGAIFFLIAQLHYHADQYEAAKEACQHAIQYFGESDNKRGVILSTTRMASILSALYDNTEGLRLLYENEPLVLQLDLPYISCGFYGIKAEILLAVKDYDGCKDALETAIPHALAANNPRNILDIEKTQFALHLELGHIPEARATLDKMLKISRDHNDRHWEMKLYKFESEYYAKIGDPKQSLDFYKLYHEREKKITKESTEVRLMMIHVNHELIEKERESELYRLRSEKLQRELMSKSTHLASESEVLSRVRQELVDILSQPSDATTALRSIKNKIQEMPRSAVDWEEYDKHFLSAHPDFIKNLLDKFPTLSPAETKICALLRVGLTSKEIAHMLTVSERSVENHRYRIRKKIGIGDTNIIQFLNAI